MNDSPAAKDSSPNRKMSASTKVAIFLVTSAVLLVGVLALDIYLIADKFGSQITDPVKIKKLAAAMADLEPLPERFRYLMCIDVGELKSVVIEDNKTGVTYTLLKRQHNSSKLTDEALLEGYLNHRETFGLEEAGLMKGFTPSKRGHLAIAGQSMPYAIGHSHMSKFQVTQLIGLVTPAEKKDSFILFLVQTPSNQPLVVEDVHEFSKYIKRFK